MPQTVTIERKLYTFDELSDDAKDKARDWFRDGDEFFTDFIYSDAVEVGARMGIEIDTRPVKLMGRGTRHDPVIYWSGFWSQGDGACFEGWYRYRKGAAKLVREHAPQDAELHRIVDDLQAVQKKFLYRLEAKVKHSGHYYHSGCTSIDVTYSEDQYRDIGDAEETVAQLLRDFMDWIYKQLEAEYDHQTSNDTVDENILANGYTFDADGRRLDAGDK